MKTLEPQFQFQKYLFQFGLDSANGQRILPVEMAVSLWQLVFSQVRLVLLLVELIMMLLQEEPALLKKWLHFLEKHPQVIFVCHSALCLSEEEYHIHRHSPFGNALFGKDIFLVNFVFTFFCSPIL